MSEIPQGYKVLDTNDDGRPLVDAPNLSPRGIVRTAAEILDVRPVEEVIDLMDAERDRIKVISAGMESKKNGKAFSNLVSEDMSELVERASTVEEFVTDNAQWIVDCMIEVKEVFPASDELFAFAVVMEDMVASLIGCGIEQRISEQTSINTTDQFEDHKGLDFDDGGQCKAITCKNRWWKIGGTNSKSDAKDKELHNTVNFDYVVYYEFEGDGTFSLQFDQVGNYDNGNVSWQNNDDDIWMQDQ